MRMKEELPDSPDDARLDFGVIEITSDDDMDEGLPDALEHELEAMLEQAEADGTGHDF